MTAPFAPPPPRPVIVVLILLGLFVIALPFGRREDWLGWVAFLVIAAVAVTLWGILLWGVVRKIIEHRQNRAKQNDRES